LVPDVGIVGGGVGKVVDQTKESDRITSRANVFNERGISLEFVQEFSATELLENEIVGLTKVIMKVGKALVANLVGFEKRRGISSLFQLPNIHIGSSRNAKIGIGEINSSIIPERVNDIPSVGRNLGSEEDQKVFEHSSVSVAFVARLGGHFQGVELMLVGTWAFWSRRLVAAGGTGMLRRLVLVTIVTSSIIVGKRSITITTIGTGVVTRADT